MFPLYDLAMSLNWSRPLAVLSVDLCVDSLRHLRPGVYVCRAFCIVSLLTELVQPSLAMNGVQQHTIHGSGWT